MDASTCESLSSLLSPFVLPFFTAGIIGIGALVVWLDVTSSNASAESERRARLDDLDEELSEVGSAGATGLLSRRLETLGYSKDVALRVAIEDVPMARDIISWDRGPVKSYVGFPFGGDPRDWQRMHSAFRAREDYARDDLKGHGIILIEAEVPWHLAYWHQPYLDEDLSIEQRAREERNSHRLHLESADLPRLARFTTRTLF